MKVHLLAGMSKFVGLHAAVHG